MKLDYMQFVPFYEYFPGVAERETKELVVSGPSSTLEGWLYAVKGDNLHKITSCPIAGANLSGKLKRNFPSLSPDRHLR
jgi:hypothetical protein